MEVSTVSPPPPSPTEEDSCGIDATNVGIHSVMLLISLCGLVGNGAVLWFLHFNPITNFLFYQTITDFLFLVFMVPSTLLFLLEDVSCSALVPLKYSSLLLQLSLFCYDLGLLRLTFIIIERCRSILCPLCWSCKVPQHLFWVVMNVLFWVFFLTMMAVTPTVNSLCQSHEQEHCRVAFISLYTLYLILFATTMVLSSTILFIHLKHGFQQKQRQRLRVAIFFTVVFNLPLSLWHFLQQLGYTVVSSQVVLLLTCITSTIKPLIFFLMGSWKKHFSTESCRRHFSKQCLREVLQRVFKEPEENTACSNDVAMNTAV